MLTVILECRDEEQGLAHTLSTLVSGAVEGLVGDVIVLDHASKDGTERVAEAAGCRFHTEWKTGDIIASARGEWILMLEPGSRPQSGWIDDISEYISVSTAPAHFAPSRHYRRPFWVRLTRRAAPLEYGLLLRKQDALSAAKSGMSLSDFAKLQKSRSLGAELIPAGVIREKS